MLTVIKPNHRWNNICHTLWFSSTIVGLFCIIFSFYHYEFVDLFRVIVIFFLFEIFLGLVVCVHLMELLILKH